MNRNIIKPWMAAYLILGSLSFFSFGNARAEAPLPVPSETSRLEQVNLGGVRQTISIHAKDSKKPVLLFLHGGPGYSEIPYAGWFEKGLEDHFIIVHWDQRGTGLSYSRDIPPESMTLEQFVSDTKDLTLYLRKRFGRKKIYLVGHSWGTILGTLVVQRYPELFYAYVGIGQVVDVAQSEQISYEYALDQAKKLNNESALHELSRLAPPPEYGGSIEQLNIQRKWLAAFGGSFFDRNVDLQCSQMYLSSPDYGALDPMEVGESIRFSITSLSPQILKVNFLKTATELKVPVYFFEGRHDYTTYYGLAEKYFQRLKAPRKELIWFEKSGHHPHMEEPEKFAQILCSKLKLPKSTSPTH